MIKIRLIEQGNFTRETRLALIAIGFGVMYSVFRFVPPSIWGAMLALTGLAIAAVGGFASRAAMLKIKPFDNSYKKARDSYKVKDEKQEGQK